MDFSLFQVLELAVNATRDEHSISREKQRRVEQAVSEHPPDPSAEESEKQQRRDGITGKGVCINNLNIFLEFPCSFSC